MLLIKILLFILLALLILLLIVLLVPFDYQAKGDSRDEKILTVKVQWLFGLVSITGSYAPTGGFEGMAKIFGIQVKLDADSITSNRKKTQKGEQDKKNRFRLITADRDTISYILRNFKKLLKHVTPSTVNIRGVLGFEDPCHTGLACILLETLREFHLHRIQIRYVFYEEVFQGEFYLEGRIYLAYTAYIAVRLLLKKSVRVLIFK